LRAIQETQKQGVYLVMGCSCSGTEVQLLLNAGPQLLLYEGRLLAGIDHTFVADLT
jgi:hypothetical protein